MFQTVYKFQLHVLVYLLVRGPSVATNACLLCDSVNEVKQRRNRLVLGWVIARED